MERKNLLVGAGRNHAKKFYVTDEGPAWNGALVTVDINPDCGATVLHDMSERPFPFADAEFDEIHAYDCLEHWGRQGDWRGWFDEMAEFHRILKPGGEMRIVVPFGEDRFADPGHTRFFGMNHFMLLDRKWCEGQVAAGTSVADYRWYWKLDFDVTYSRGMGEPVHHLGVILRRPPAVLT